MPSDKHKRRILVALGVGLVGLAALIARPAMHLISTASRDAYDLADLPEGYTDDASRLNQTAVGEVWDVPVDADDPEGQIAGLLARATREGLRVSIALNTNAITDISPVSGLTSLTFLPLDDNQITDISALGRLTSLTRLGLSTNQITDINALSRLTSLRILALFGNPDLTDIQPLLDNTGLGAGDQVYLGGTNVSCTDLDALKAKGVTLDSDCP